ncbi:hypothetical protein IBA8401_38260 [Pseudomonas syringae]
MSVKRPSKADFLIAAQDHGYDLSDSQMESFLSLADETLGSYEAIDALYAAHVAQPALLREHSKPAAAENPYGAWYVKTHITGAASGPLAGRTVVIKDNVSVAGVPMANGSLSLDGYVPSEDATWSSVCWPPERRSLASRCAKTCVSPAPVLPRPPAR